MLTTTDRKPARKRPVNHIRAVLIDPFKCDAFNLVVDWEDQADIHKLLDCDLIQSVPMDSKRILWVDESGLLREPFVYPQFKILGVNADCPLTGYGLVTGLKGGNISDYIPASNNGIAYGVVWEEHWTRRINPDECIDQLLRIYSYPKWEPT